MPSLLESLGQSLTPQAVDTIGSAFGLDPKLVQQGMNLVGPVVQGGFANSTSSQQGLDSLMQLLTPPQGAPAPQGQLAGLGGLLESLSGSASETDMLGGLLSAVTGQGSGGGGDLISTLLAGLFGAGGLAAIGPTLDKALGFKVSPLIPLVAPLLLSLLRKTTQEKRLDAQGVANLLQQEQQEFMTRGGDTAKLVQQALDAGQEAVALQSKFAPDEWTKVRLAPMAAALVVMNASRSGPVGATQEMAAASKAIADTHSQASPTSLLNIAFDAPLSDEEQRLISPEVSRDSLLATLKGAASAVATKSGSEALAYRQLLTSVATAVAEAAKEGGFLGFGGTRVSDAEKEALADIAAAIGA